MTVAAIREKLHNYITEADDEQLLELLDIVEERAAPAYEWSEDEGFVAELDDRVKRWEDGIDKGVTMEEVKASFERLKKERADRRSI